jgi:hypothetical protein
MYVTTPEVLIGDYDWEGTLIPRAEYDSRIAAIWSKLSDLDLSGLVVYGNKVENAALAYVSNFTPKIDAAVALLPRKGEMRIHSAGSPQMMVNAKRLTWAEDVRPLRDIGRDISEWVEGQQQGELGLWLSPEAPSYVLQQFEVALRTRKFRDVSNLLNPLLREKSSVALKLMLAASRMLEKGARALQTEFKRGVTAREAAVAAEIAVCREGAQDVRVLISLSDGGTPTAVDYPVGPRLDPLLAYIAVRHGGYWVEGYLTLASTENDPLMKTKAVLEAMLGKAKGGSTAVELSRTAAQVLGQFDVHPAVNPPFIGIGLMRDESGLEAGGEADALEIGRVYSLRAGAHNATRGNALLSALVIPTNDGLDVLWSSLL